jgi:hypothetical protein
MSTVAEGVRVEQQSMLIEQLLRTPVAQEGAPRSQLDVIARQAEHTE